MNARSTARWGHDASTFPTESATVGHGAHGITVKRSRFGRSLFFPARTLSNWVDDCEMFAGDDYDLEFRGR